MSRGLKIDRRSLTAQQITLEGRVQGHGIRPAIARLARRLGLVGWVRNSTEGVRICIESESISVLSEFRRKLGDALPKGCDLQNVIVSEGEPRGLESFRIIRTTAAGPLSAHVPPDLGICENCRVDLSHGRRRTFPFTTCTDCGPRYSIIESLPYDRELTSMREFEPCHLCRTEYSDIDDRRFHSQTNACPQCGPQLTGHQLPLAGCNAQKSNQSSLAVSATASLTQTAAEVPSEQGNEAVHAAAGIILAGGLVAIQGIGGFQLVCDATNHKAVDRLRNSKGRPTKPFAVMVPSEKYLRKAAPSAQGSTYLNQQLLDPANPIVLADRSTVPEVSARVSPGLNTVGVFLPSSPLHELLLSRVGGPLVVTSLNIDGEPLVFEFEALAEELSNMAEYCLQHNRRIVRPIDDSVIRVIEKRPVTVRCGRGLAPLPLKIRSPGNILAVGGDQKVAVALSNSFQTVLGGHIGNMSTIRSRRRFTTEVDRLLQLYGATPQVLVHDLHPDFFTTRWAEDQNLPTMAVQHHHAHVAATMLEHSLMDQKVLGVAFDGTGFGTDDTIWGGEFLVATSTDFRRAARFSPFLLPGGESSIREPWRIARSLLWAADVPSDSLNISPAETQSVDAIDRMISSGHGLLTSSLGRIFDGVAALVLNLQETSFEGEAAMRLEAVCDREEVGSYTIQLRTDEDLSELCWRSMIRHICNDMAARISPGRIAMKFHRGVAHAVCSVAKAYPALPVVLSGGCFQNRILTELTANLLTQHPGGRYLPGIIPPNDGGLAAGQLAVATARLKAQNNRGSR